jgi:chromosome segregation ATPase
MESLAIAFVFIGNAAAIILLAFMLFRILSQTETTHDMMRSGAAELVEAGKRLREMLQTVDRLSDRLIEANHAGGQGGRSLNLSPESLNKLSALTETLTKEGLQEHEQVINEMRHLLESLQAVKSDDYPEWRNNNQGKIDQTLNQRSQISTELEYLKIRLEEANNVINELRSANREAEAGNQTADVLKHNLEQSLLKLNKAKERALKAEASMEALSKDMAKLSAEAEQGKRTTAADMDNLREQMHALHEERNIMFNQLEEMKDVMKRTMLEKDFIEEKLLDLDEAHRPNPTDASPTSEVAVAVEQAAG